MKRIVCLSLILLAVMGCSRKADFVAVNPGDDAVVFTDDISMDRDIQIVMRRDSSGLTRADSFEIYFRKSPLGGYRPIARPLVSRQIEPADYDRVVRVLESDAFEELTHRYPPPGTDGWTWRIQRISKMGERRFAFHCPEWAEDMSGGELKGLDLLLDLGRDISRAGGASSLEAFARLQQPNQPPQRNAGSRPTSDDSPASDTPSSRGPRG